MYDKKSISDALAKLGHVSPAATRNHYIDPRRIVGLNKPTPKPPGDQKTLF